MGKKLRHKSQFAILFILLIGLLLYQMNQHQIFTIGPYFIVMSFIILCIAVYFAYKVGDYLMSYADRTEQFSIINLSSGADPLPTMINTNPDSSAKPIELSEQYQQIMGKTALLLIQSLANLESGLCLRLTKLGVKYVPVFSLGEALDQLDLATDFNFVLIAANMTELSSIEIAEIFRGRTKTRQTPLFLIANEGDVPLGWQRVFDQFLNVSMNENELLAALSNSRDDYLSKRAAV